MEQSWYWRVGFIVAVTLLSIYQLVPSWYYFKLPPSQRNDPKLYEPSVPRWAPSPASRLNLGLDLQGGIHLALGVDRRMWEQQVPVFASSAASLALTESGHKLDDAVLYEQWDWSKR